MSTTDNAFPATIDPINTPKAPLKQRWWHILDNWKVGIIPLPLFLLAGGLIALDCLGGKLPSDIVVMVATHSVSACRYSVNSARRPSARPLFLLRWFTTACCRMWWWSRLPNSISRPTFFTFISAALSSAAL